MFGFVESRHVAFISGGLPSPRTKHLIIPLILLIRAHYSNKCKLSPARKQFRSVRRVAHEIHRRVPWNIVAAHAKPLTCPANSPPPICLQHRHTRLSLRPWRLKPGPYHPRSHRRSWYGPSFSLQGRRDSQVWPRCTQNGRWRGGLEVTRRGLGRDDFSRHKQCFVIQHGDQC